MGSLLLRDGTVTTVREVTSDDRQGLIALHSTASEHSRYLRFLGTSRSAVVKAVDRLTLPAGDDHLCIVAEQDGHLLGVAEFQRVPSAGPAFDVVRDPSQAEVALLVADDEHGRGVGTLLFERLVEEARRRGVDEFVADVLTGNHPMLKVITDLGLTVRGTTSAGVYRACIELSPTACAQTAAEQRHRSAEVASLRSLLNPRSVAVVGAGPHTDKVGGATLANIIAGGFTGPVYPVCLENDVVQGLPAYRSLRDLPAPVDLVVFAVPAATVVTLLPDCGPCGARSAIVLASGFADAGEEGKKLQVELMEVAGRSGLRIVGPNCLGLVTRTDAGFLAATFAPHIPLPGSVGVLTQSGGMAIALVEHARRAGIGMSNLLSVGNKADVSGNDMLAWWLEDDTTSVCALYLESFGNPRRFSRLARELSARKPVIVVKAGTSDVGGRAARSHTAAGASPRRSVNALLRQAGVIQVDHVGELVEMVALLASTPLPAGDRLAIISNAGGVGILAADAAEGYGLRVAAFTAELQAELRDVLPTAASTGNPIDTTPAVSAAAFLRAVQTLADAEEVDSVVVGLTSTPVGDVTAIEHGLASVARSAGKPIVLVSSDGLSTLQVDGGSGVREQRPDVVSAVGALPAFAFPEAAVRSLARAATYARHRSRPQAATAVVDGVVRRTVRHLVRQQNLPSGGGWLGPDVVATLLAAYGIDTEPVVRVRTPAQAAAAAAAAGWPVALKAIGGGLVHKSDVGGVALGLATVDDVRHAFSEMQARLADRMDYAVVQRMAAPGVELIVGVTVDPAFGPLVLCGLGGVWSDLLDDREYRLTPLAPGDAESMVRGLKGYQLLRGFRGSTPADVVAVERLLTKVAALADDVPEIGEIDLNPVIVHPYGLSIVDAKVFVSRG